jgi:ABC-type phosphate transport system substrate-binding protein
MKFSKLLQAASLLAATAAFGSLAHAATTYQVKVLTVGSSAQYGVFAEAAYQLAKTEGSAAHYTVKSSSSAPESWVADSRGGTTNPIPNEYGNLWVVWSNTTGDIWAYITVDSTVGVRAFEATPRAKLGLAAAPLPLSSTTNLFVWDDGTNDTALPTLVYDALSNATFTAANTDIRPEDALFATRRALAKLDSTDWTGLGYGTGPTTLVGTAIQGEVTSGSKATPVNFELSFSTDSFDGKDPFTGDAVPAFVTIPIGAAPIVFIANKTDASGLAAVSNITSAEALTLFSGAECDDSVLGGASSIGVYPFLREPLSGTMNTTEFSVFRTSSPWTTSQEEGVLGTSGSYNPLNLGCTKGSGKRERAIGTGDVVKGVNAQEDGIGYVFFSYEALNAKSTTTGGGNAPNVKYLTLNGIDPINATYTAGGALPVCGSATSPDFSCPVPAGTATTGLNSFPNLRSGSYPAWSQYRMITDSTGQTNTQALVNEADFVADQVLPDFVPVEQACGSSASHDEQGLAVYREHFTITGSTGTAPSYGIAPTANNGSFRATLTCSGRSLWGRTLGGGSEEGGDVGGTIVYTAAGHNPTSTIETTPVHY